MWRRNLAERFTAAQQDQVIAMYCAGRSVRYIGERLAVSPSVIRRLVHTLGLRPADQIEPLRLPPDPELLHRLRQLRPTGSLYWIAQQLNISPARVYRLCWQHQVPAPVDYSGKPVPPPWTPTLHHTTPPAFESELMLQLVLADPNPAAIVFTRVAGEGLALTLLEHLLRLLLDSELMQLPVVLFVSSYEGGHLAVASRPVTEFDDVCLMCTVELICGCLTISGLMDLGGEELALPLCDPGTMRQAVRVILQVARTGLGLVRAGESPFTAPLAADTAT